MPPDLGAVDVLCDARLLLFEERTAAEHPCNHWADFGRICSRFSVKTRTQTHLGTDVENTKPLLSQGLGGGGRSLMRTGLRSNFPTAGKNTGNFAVLECSAVDKIRELTAPQAFLIIFTLFFAGRILAKNRELNRPTSKNWDRGLAVGTLIAERPPHRSERAQFRHSAPTLGV